MQEKCEYCIDGLDINGDKGFEEGQKKSYLLSV